MHVCVYVFVLMCLCVHTHTHACMHAYIHTFTHSEGRCVSTNKQTNKQTHKQTHTHTHSVSLWKCSFPTTWHAINAIFFFIPCYLCMHACRFSQLAVAMNEYACLGREALVCAGWSLCLSPSLFHAYIMIHAQASKHKLPNSCNYATAGWSPSLKNNKSWKI